MKNSGPAAVQMLGVCAIALSSCLLLSKAAPARAEIIDRILAVVGGVVITQSDVTAASKLGLVAVEGAGELTSAVLSRLVDRQLILAEVDRYAPPEPTTDAVDRERQRTRARFESAEAYDAALARSGIDEKHLRQTLRDDLRIRGYLEQRFIVPTPTEEELSRYYRERIATFTRNGETAPLEAVRAEVGRMLTEGRRQSLIDGWVGGLRRRAPIELLSSPRP